MKLYNHLTGQSELISSKVINFYVCGPTVHAVSHVGHGRTFCVFDSLRKYLTSKGYVVNYGMNITDIDDKINAKVRKLYYSKLLGDDELNLEQLEAKMLKNVGDGIFDLNKMTPPMELFYEFVNERTEKFWKELEGINVDKPTITLRVTQVLPHIENMIQSLIDKGMAYESNGSVYFNTNYYYSKFCRCALSNSTEDDINLKDGFTSEKLNSHDFALWKSAKPHCVSFPTKKLKNNKGDSLTGWPGWSIECSVMSSIMFGDSIDLHGGGIDLKFPHHQTEFLYKHI
jgi:cysteinyl-tRNA synthetase